MKQIAIVDYGLGNLFSIQQACKSAGLSNTITADPTTILKADGLILPGVGAFGNAMEYLHTKQLTTCLLAFAKSGKPFLGICLGMQLLFNESEEFGTHKGLGIVDGTVLKFKSSDPAGKKVKVPQIQWNQIFHGNPDLWSRSALKKCKSGTYMHFVHSFYVEAKNESEILAYSEYGGIKYTSAIKKDNITGLQFHPEKSGIHGIEIYREWALTIK